MLGNCRLQIHFSSAQCSGLQPLHLALICTFDVSESSCVPNDIYERIFCVRTRAKSSVRHCQPRTSAITLDSHCVRSVCQQH